MFCGICAGNSQSHHLTFGKRVSRRGREIITPWALLGEASRRRAQGCNSSYIEECSLSPSNLPPRPPWVVPPLIVERDRPEVAPHTPVAYQSHANGALLHATLVCLS